MRDGLDLVPHDELHDLVTGEVGCGSASDDVTVAEDGEAVGQLLDLFEVVGDEEHTRTLRRDVAREVEQHGGVVLREEDGRLVQDQEPVGGGSGHSPDDGEQRTLDRPQLADESRGVEGDAELLKLLASVAAPLLPADRGLSSPSPARRGRGSPARSGLG